MEKDFSIKPPKKQASVAILISNKIDFKLKFIKRDGVGFFTLIVRKKSNKTKSQF